MFRYLVFLFTFMVKIFQKMKNTDIENEITRIHNLIKFNRKLKGMSHETMASLLDISTSSYHKIEHQETKLTLDRFLKIQKILSIPFKEIFELSTENTYNQEFNDNTVVNQNQQIENLYQDNRELTQGYINTLKEEISFLKSIIESK